MKTRNSNFIVLLVLLFMSFACTSKNDLPLLFLVYEEDKENHNYIFLGKNYSSLADIFEEYKLIIENNFQLINAEHIPHEIYFASKHGSGALYGSQEDDHNRFLSNLLYDKDQGTLSQVLIVTIIQPNDFKFLLKEQFSNHIGEILQNMKCITIIERKIYLEKLDSEVIIPPLPPPPVKK